jgi:hypothetical protein
MGDNNIDIVALGLPSAISVDIYERLQYEANA